MKATAQRMDPGVDVHEQLENWARYVQWGDDGSPKEAELCGSAEREYFILHAHSARRWQYEPPPLRQDEPRFHDGERVERLVCHPEFPTVWKRVLVVEYIERPARSIEEDPELYLQRKAERARVNPRTYHDYLDGAKEFLTDRLTRP